MTGPRRGLRRHVPVETDPSLVRLVGIDGEPAADGNARPTLAYGHLSSVADSLREHPTTASELSRRTDIPARTLRRHLRGERVPHEDVAAAIVTAALRVPRRRCICGSELPGRRSDEKWCGEPCRKRHERARTPEDPGDAAVRLLVACVDGVAQLDAAALSSSPKLGSTICRALDAGFTPDALADAVAAFGPLTSARSPVGALVTRIRRVTEHRVTADTERAAGRVRGARSRGRLLGALVRVGESPLDEAEAELAGAYGTDTDLAAVAAEAFEEHR
jgi:hypothetical protein